VIGAAGIAHQYQVLPHKAQLPPGHVFMQGSHYVQLKHDALPGIAGGHLLGNSCLILFSH
jgi:hypothetical protein